MHTIIIAVNRVWKGKRMSGIRNNKNIGLFLKQIHAGTKSCESTWHGLGICIVFFSAVDIRPPAGSFSGTHPTNSLVTQVSNTLAKCSLGPTLAHLELSLKTYLCTIWKTSLCYLGKPNVSISVWVQPWFLLHLVANVYNRRTLLIISLSSYKVQLVCSWQCSSLMIPLCTQEW